MYSILDLPNGRALMRLPNCKKVFTSEGKLVKFQGNNALLPKDAKIAVCKILPWEMHNIRLAKTRQSLHYDAVIERYGLGEHIGVDEEEILLASLEVLETY